MDAETRMTFLKNYLSSITDMISTCVLLRIWVQ